MKNVSLMIFDLDGTLIDSVKDIINSVNFTLKQSGFNEKSFQEINSYIGTGVQDLIKKSLGDKSDAYFEEGIKIFEKHYKDHFSDNTRLFPGVKETLEYFKDKKKAIATNKKKYFAEKSLERLGILGYFDRIYGGDDAHCLKPSPCNLESIIDEFRIDRKESIMVGDMAIDVLAGKKAGMISCAVTYGIGKIDDIRKTEPDYIIDKFRDLKKIII